jgi:undecaprenyl-diphosphatase
VLVPLLVASAGFLLLLRKKVMALAVLASGGGAMVLEGQLKDLFARPRPQVVPRLVPAWNPSFPSGHALLSSAVYLSIAVLVVRLVPYRRVRLYVLALAALLVGLIGFSRVLLGVHYPTDVVAGWIVGGLWALLCGVGARALQRLGAAEPPGLPPELTADASAPAPTSEPRASRGPAAPRR